MKSTINYYYNLFPNEIIKQDNFFYFWINDEKFYFVPFNNDVKVVDKIYNKLLSKQKKTNHIILNKEKSMVTLFKGREYTLLRVNCIENEFVEIENFYIISMEGVPVNWGEVWSKKIDYLEYQVNQRGLGKDNILNSFSYYVGLAENAIQYYNILDLKDVGLSIQHKRIYGENYEINYYNPINMLIDYEVRDIAEYIKFSFFFNKLNMNQVFRYINDLRLNSLMLNLLFVRLLFPTYYFDHYERLLNEEETEAELLNIINKTKDYELLLKKFYLYYAKSHNLFRIEWLIDS